MEPEAGDLDGSGPPISGVIKRAEAALKGLEALVRDLQIPTSLREFGAAESHLPDLAVSASKVTRLLDNNPVELALEDIEAIYRRLL
jgi:alcohol dehydrogenase class IV